MSLQLQLSGGIIAVGTFQLLLGASGTIGFLMNYIGPLTIAPTLILLCMGVGQSLVTLAQPQWGICILWVPL